MDYRGYFSRYIKIKKYLTQSTANIQELMFTYNHDELYMLKNIPMFDMNELEDIISQYKLHGLYYHISLHNDIKRVLFFCIEFNVNKHGTNERIRELTNDEYDQVMNIALQITSADNILYSHTWSHDEVCKLYAEVTDVDINCNPYPNYPPIDIRI